MPIDRLLQTVAKGVVNADVTSTLAARISRLALRCDREQEKQVAEVAGYSMQDLAANLLDAIDPDRNAERAIRKFNLPAEAEPTEEQLDAVEAEAQQLALKPFYDPKVRDVVLGVRDSLEQVIDEVSRDNLISAGFSAASAEKAKSVIGELKEFCEKHREEIEALQLLYEKPYRSGLKFRHIKDLANRLKRAPFYIDPAKPDSVRHLWQLQQVAEPTKVKGDARSLVDLIAIVRHALHPKEPVVPVAEQVETNYREWLSEQESEGNKFTPEQVEWLDMIKNHIATSLAITKDSFEDAPFVQKGGLGKVFALFGEKLEPLLTSLNERLAA